MNAYPDFDLGPVQPGNESESSNSVGIYTPVQRDLQSPEPEIDSFQCWGFFSHTPAETQYESTSNSVPGNTLLAQAKFAGKSQLCGDNDSDSSDIQNFIRILGRCTHSEKENSWNQVESTKKDLAASQLTEGLALRIHCEKTSSNSEGPQQEDSKLQSDEKYSFQDKKSSEEKDTVVKQSNGDMIKRVWCLDLNLTPFENDVEFLFGKMAPSVDCLL